VGAFALVAALALLELCMLGSATAAAGSQPRAAQIDVFSPKPGTRISRATVRVRVRSSTSAAFSAYIDGRNISGRFERHGGVRAATLRRGRDFRLGENHLRVAAGRGQFRRAEGISFLARRRSEPLLTLSEHVRRHSRTPLRVELRVSKPVTRLTLVLNGHRVALGPTGGRRVWRVRFGASDGLRFGHNTLTAEAERAGSGRFDHERRRFLLDRSAPIVGAGPDRTTRTGRAVVLDGSDTRAGSRRGALLYRWKIVARPRGSRARIVDSTAKKARLLPDLPGYYRVRLVAARVSLKTKAAEERAQASAAPPPAPPSEPTCLQSVSAASSSAGEGPVDPLEPPPDPLEPLETALNPLESPPCVTPTGDLTTPPLPLEAQQTAAADDVGVATLATEAPIGWPIETITADGTIQVGPQTFSKTGGFARLVVLNQTSLMPEEGAWGSGNQRFLLGEAAQLSQAVEATTDRQIVVITGMGQAQTEGPKPAQEALAKSIAALGGTVPPASAQAEIIAGGKWSVIGTRGEPGRTFTNLYGLSQQSPAGSSIGSLPGSINGYLQPILVHAFSYVSPEFIPIDTRATGSSNTVNIFKVGEETATSETIGSGSLGLHIAAFDAESASGKLTLLDNSTFVIDGPYSSTDQQGVEEAADYLAAWRQIPSDALIVMQTFGEEGYGPNTAPWASASWVNDALIHPGDPAVHEWYGQPYLQVHHSSEVEEKLDQMWNSVRPTVAGEVGNLTGPVGHDLVANFGAGNPAVEVSRLTMVAMNHPDDPAANYVKGDAPGPNGTPEGRLVGLLTRNPEGALSVQGGVSTSSFSPADIWETAFAPPTAWPLSETAEQRAAMANLAYRLWPGQAVTSVREQYVKAEKASWSTIRTHLLELRYEPTRAFTEATFDALVKQLAIEMDDIVAVQKVIGTWKEIFGVSETAGELEVKGLSEKIVETAVKDAKLDENKESEISPEEIISDSLYVAAGLLGFPESAGDLRVAETVGVVASGFGLAEAVNPEPPTGAQGPDTSAIRARAGELGKALAEHLEHSSEMLSHLTAIISSDWGKLQQASTAADGPWALSGESSKTLEQSLAVAISQQFNEGLLPLAYQEWVVSPYFTGNNPSGPVPPGTKYACRQYEPAFEDESIKRPFASEPAGGLSTAIYRPFDEPGASTPPAVGNTTPFTLRALKSTYDPLRMHRVEYTEEHHAITVYHDGSSPPRSLIEPLFQAVNPGEMFPNHPSSLGMNKTEFYAGFGGGPTDWRRLICGEE